LIDWCSPKRKKMRNQTAQEASMDLVRVENADWLARNATGSALAPFPTQRQGTESTLGNGTGDRRPDAEATSSSEPLGAAAAADFETGIPPIALVDDSVRPDALEQVNALAKAMTEDIWQDIVKDLPGSTEEIRMIRLQLADHGWCDLFIGFVLVLEKFGKAIDTVPDRAKKLIVEAIRGSSKQEKRPRLTEHVVGMIVDKAWGAFKTAAVAHVPLFGLLTSDELLRNLRMLAVFICPAPEKHEEVRKHAVDPLVKDARGYVSEEAKEWLAKQFDQWATGVERQAERDSREETGRAGEPPVASPTPA
jgi:hypothetical protein